MLKALLLGMLSGFLNGHAFVDHGAAALVANVPLLVALRTQRSALQTALLGAVVGFLGGVHIYGILDYGALLFLAFSTYTASQMVVYALLFRHMWRRLGPWVDVALPAALWTLTEWMRTVGPLCMPASYVGCIADVPWLRPMLALAPLTGGLGVSTVVALTQSVVFHGLFGDRNHRRPAAVGAVIVLFFATLGLWRPPDVGDLATQGVEVAAVQGGLPNSAYKAALADPAVSRDIVRTYAELSQTACASGAQLVLWPETAVRLPVTVVPALRERLLPPADREVTLLAGLPFDLSPHGPQGGQSNAALVVRPGGVIADRYDKVRLVPGHEALYTPGTEWRPVTTPVGQIGVLICLESVYPDVGRALTAGGAELLAVISNDAGFGSSPIAHHMTNRAIVQAVENGRWLVRVGQAGISTIIDPTGAPHGSLGLFEYGVLRGRVARRTDLTPYTRFGDWWMAVVGLVLGGWIIRRGRRE